MPVEMAPVVVEVVVIVDSVVVVVVVFVVVVMVVNTNGSSDVRNRLSFRISCFCGSDFLKAFWFI